MKKVFLITFLIIASFVILPLKDYALDEVGEELQAYIGEVKILSVSTPTRIVIGNPEIVDVTNVTKSEVTLSPKAQGSTTLVVWDNFGEHSYRVNVLAEHMQDVKRRVDNLLEKLNLPGVYTQAVDEEGKVLLLGKVKTSQDRERISTVLGTLKDKTVDLILVKEEEAVVDIDVEVFELNKDASTTLGFTWPTSGTLTFTEKGSPGIGTASTKWSTLFKVLNLNRTAFVWTLDALVQEGKARILSRPRLACQSGKEAELMVGGEKPTFATYVTAEGGATGANIEYKEYGIKLKIKPTVTEEKRIKVGLNIEVSEVEKAETFATAGSAYPLKKRNASTEVFLNDGQTLAIGGLIKQKFEEDLEKTPGLGDIPILGIFFRKKTTAIGGGGGERGDTELFITLTPTIVSEKEGAVGEKKEIKSALVAPTVPATPSVKEVPPPVAPPIKEVTPKPAPLQNYISIVQRRILDNLNYPDSAKEAGFQGVVKLGLRISYSGELLDVSVKSSSGYSILDDNAVSVTRGISPYPPFPPSIDQKEISIEIPIVYRLD